MGGTIRVSKGVQSVANDETEVTGGDIVKQRFQSCVNLNRKPVMGSKLGNYRQTCWWLNDKSLLQSCTCVHLFTRVQTRVHTALYIFIRGGRILWFFPKLSCFIYFVDIFDKLVLLPHIYPPDNMRMVCFEPSENYYHSSYIRQVADKRSCSHSVTKSRC